MSENKKMCSFKDHKEIESVCYCQECKIYMCNNCTEYHKGLFEGHNLINNNEKKEIVDEYCQHENHFQKLGYFCRNHNELCCAACIAKIKNNGDGEHSDCDICILKEIKTEKKSILEENMKYIAEITSNIDKSLEEIKELIEFVTNKKDVLRQKIEEEFNELRNEINKREETLISELENIYNNLFFEENFIKNYEEVYNKIRAADEKGRRINEYWNDDNKIIIVISNCIEIEKNIKEYNKMKDYWNKCDYNRNVKIYLNDENMNEILESIKTFGMVSYDNYRFKECPKYINDNRRYIISGENDNILTKIGKNNYAGAICKFELNKKRNHQWKIKILKAKYNQIMVGVATNDFDINSSNHHNCGWYLNCYNSTLYSGPPHNYNGVRTELGKVLDEIVVSMDMKTGNLKFLINNEDKGDQYINIPLDKPIYPAVLLFNKNSSIQISEC